mmetsp:Transcript_29696/g.65818  ORF Transcript_29696/g.65818 Transcript_29696/m.65818 type:complete len:199 (+) Transcript_29696:448-1044(+)
MVIYSRCCSRAAVLCAAFNQPALLLLAQFNRVNLPAKDKMTKPRYQAILKDSIVVVPLPDGAGEVRIIAGEYESAKGPASTFTPINVWDVRLKAGASSELVMPAGHRTVLFVRKGTLKVGNAADKGHVGMAQAAVLTDDGTTLSLENVGTEDCAFMILGGEPLNEPIAARGPFVMNTDRELQQAMADYQSGRMGSHFN